MINVALNAERVLAAVAALLLFTLNELRMFNTGPRMPDLSGGRVHAIWMQIDGAPAEIYFSTLDLAVRFGLAGVTAALAFWALAETLQRQPARQSKR